MRKSVLNFKAVSFAESMDDRTKKSFIEKKECNALPGSSLFPSSLDNPSTSIVAVPRYTREWVESISHVVKPLRVPLSIESVTL